MVYPPPLKNRASVACAFEDAAKIRAAGKRNIFMDLSYFSPMTRGPKFLECFRGAVGDSLPLTKFSGSGLPVKQILLRPPFGDDEATEISADANPLT